MLRRLAMLLVLMHINLSANAARLDGTWLKNGSDAFVRVYVNHAGTPQDVSDSSELVAFLTGIVVVHKQNNLLALVVWSSVEKKTDKTGQVKLSAADAARVET